MFASSLHQYFPDSLPLQHIYWQPSYGHPVLVYSPLLLYQSHLVTYRVLLLDHTIMKELPFLHFNLLIFFGSGNHGQIPKFGNRTQCELVRLKIHFVMNEKDQWKMDLYLGPLLVRFLISTWSLPGVDMFILSISFRYTF